MEHLLEFCNSEKQRTKIKLYIQLGSVAKVAASLGVAHQTVSESIRLVKKRAAKQGLAPEANMNHLAATGFNVKGVSTLYGDEGQVKVQWVKTQQDAADPEEIARVFNEMLSDFSAAPVSPPKEVEADLLADLQKATKMLVERSPNTDECVILQLGDFYHSDNPQNRTERGGNALDVDGRWHKVLKVGINLMIELVMSALSKHKHVTVKNICGNHDSNSAHFLGIAMEAYFRNEPRVTVDTSPSKYWYYEFGKILIGSTHGDTAKPEKLPGIMAADKPREWGKAEFRYWYTGHIHNKQAMEFPGVLWESFRTLAAKDAWHSSMGYRSARDMSCIIHHKDYGEIGRNTASLQLIRSQ